MWGRRVVCTSRAWEVEAAILIERGGREKRRNGQLQAVRSESTDLYSATDLLGRDSLVRETLDEIEAVTIDVWPHLAPLFTSAWLPRDGAGAASALLRVVAAGPLRQTWRPSGGYLPRWLEGAVFGGRQEVYRVQGGSDLTEYDAVSAYPRAMQGRLPCGPPIPLPLDAPRLDFELWDVSVRPPSGPPHPYGPLPLRIGEIVAYPWGQWRGFYWREEVEAAKARGWTGRIHRRWGFKGSDVWSDLFCRLVAAREQAGLSSKFWKMLAVRLIGHLGTKPGVWVYRNAPDAHTPTPLGSHWMYGRTDKIGKEVRVPSPKYARRQLASYAWMRGRIEALEALDALWHLQPAMLHVDAVWAHEGAVDLPPHWRIKEGMAAPWYIPYSGARQSQGAWLATPGIRGADSQTRIEVAIENRRVTDGGNTAILVLE